MSSKRKLLSVSPSLSALRARRLFPAMLRRHWERLRSGKFSRFEADIATSSKLFISKIFGAEEGTRTHTPLRVRGPEPRASANSATSARDTYLAVSARQAATLSLANAASSVKSESG